MNAQDARRLQFDPRLSQAQIAQLPYGGWSFDQYGNPTDRDGRILDQNGRLVSQQQAYDLTVGRRNATATLQQPFPDPRAAVNQTQTGFAATGFDDRFDRIAQQDSLQQYNRQQQRSVSPPIGLPPQTNTTSTMSPSDRTPPDYQSNGTPARDPRDDSVGEKRRTTLAAQPMFNGLLLMSIVANVYLIFWLKNLRHQFHDLVASKLRRGVGHRHLRLSGSLPAVNTRCINTRLINHRRRCRHVIRRPVGRVNNRRSDHVGDGPRDGHRHSGGECRGDPNRSQRRADGRINDEPLRRARCCGKGSQQQQSGKPAH